MRHAPVAAGRRPCPAMRSTTRKLPWKSPQTTNVQLAPCQSPQSANTVTRFT